MDIPAWFVKSHLFRISWNLHFGVGYKIKISAQPLLTSSLIISLMKGNSRHLSRSWLAGPGSSPSPSARPWYSSSGCSSSWGSSPSARLWGSHLAPSSCPALCHLRVTKSPPATLGLRSGCWPLNGRKSEWFKGIALKINLFFFPPLLNQCDCRAHFPERWGGAHWAWHLMKWLVSG